MNPRWFADAVLLLHLAFVLWVAFGALAVWRWPRLAWLHLPALAWGVWILATGGICPLTPIEDALRRQAGEAGIGPSFIEHYLLGWLYPGWAQGAAGRLWQPLVAGGLVVLNVTVYGALFWRRVRRRGR
jgi:hypothetical protein